MLITAYSLPSQLDLLIQRLCGDFDVFLHADKRFTYRTQNPRLFRTGTSFRSEWGSYEQILSILELFETARRKGPYDRYVLISGQDLPCLSNAGIRAFFEARSDAEFVHGWDVKNDDWNGDGRDRLRLFWFRYDKKLPSGGVLRAAYRLKRRAKHLLEEAVHWIQRSFGLFRPFDLPMYVGSNWMDLSGDCVDYVLRYLEDNPKYLPRFKHTRCGVEAFFHCIIFNSRFRERLVETPNRYADFASGPERPRALRSGDEEAALSSGMVFARKFDERVDAEVIKAIYARTEGVAPRRAH
jgi:Core-2/I-Branching enzyme